MVKLIKRGNTYNIPIKEYICEDPDELAEIPASIGTKVYCLGNQTSYIANGEGEFIEVQSSSRSNQEDDEEGVYA